MTDERIGDILDRALTEKEPFETRPPIEQVALACYMIGENRARKQMSDRVRERLDDYPNHRYYKLQQEVKDAATAPLVQGSDEDEIRNWEIR
jgi:hypothetical protein